ncbi:ATP-dependent DNA helicase DinG [Virgibacillus kekensis]|uniref:3'-5' exonuclease DinG n=1 Tax=Virgibacillus kekensis TaxID=202261 RepID=A0ABV9DF72_9BACI
MRNKYVVIDLETTGHSSGAHDKIIEAGIVVIEDNEIVKEFSSFFNPDIPIPPFVSNLTGITDEDVREAPIFSERASEILSFFEDGYLVAHNVPFDMGFLNAELESNGFIPIQNPVIDTVELARVLFPQAPSFKLGQLAEHLGIRHEDPHRALSDAEVTAKLFLQLIKKLEKLPYETINHLLKLESNLKSDLYQILKEREQHLAFSPYEDKNIDTYKGLAFKPIEDIPVTRENAEISFGDFLDDIYEKNGKLHQKLINYEKRAGQREMSETVYDAIQTGKHALIEAETGTGKSLAYLLPAVYDAVKSHKRILISTYTTQLQSQLIEEEIPMLRGLVSFPFNAAILKGMQHYISLQKFERTLSSNQGDNYDTVLTKAMILVWLTETETGDIDEIQLPSSGYLFYKRVSTDAEDYSDPSSPWFARSYYQQARRKAQQADIIITNHALLCLDLFSGYQLLPSYEKVIIDEAHHLEETASKHYGLKLDYVHIQYTLSQVGSSSEGGWLGKLLAQDVIDASRFKNEKWDELFAKARYEADDLFRQLFQYVVKQQQNNKSLSDIGRVQYRFENEKEDKSQWNTILEMASRLMYYLGDLVQILSVSKEFSLGLNSERETEPKDITRITIALQAIIDSLDQLFLLNDETNDVKWIEIEAYGAKNAVYLYREPTEVSSLLADDFFSRKRSVILTSATLTMKNSFSFIQNRLGLVPDEIITRKIESPFTYRNQVQLMVPSDFPDIRKGNQEEFIYSTCEAILSLAQITNGRMLVLFTSYDMLKKSYNLLREIMDTNKYMLIAQGVSSGSRSRLKKNFQTFDQSILLGTSSFWEGVDIPGEDLSCLVIVRLPFQPPNHPIYEAKSNQFKEKGKNAFFELSLPEAVIRFKQGFGRLIRSSADRGIVFVCDARIIQARYGKFFTGSIPDVPITYEPTKILMDKAEEWF